MTPLQLINFLDETIVGIPMAWIIGGAILTAIIGIIVRLWVEYRRDPFQPSIDQLMESSDNKAGVADPRETSKEPRDLPPLLLTARTRFLQGQYQGTIQAVYLYARNYIGNAFGVEVNGTHWEFFDRCEAEGIDTDIDAMRSITDLYERSMFEEGMDPQEEDGVLAFKLAERITGHPVPPQISNTEDDG